MQTIYIFDVYLHTFISFKLNRKINNRILDHFFSSIFSKFLTFGYWQKTMTDERNSCKKVRLDEKKKKDYIRQDFIISNHSCLQSSIVGISSMHLARVLKNRFTRVLRNYVIGFYQHCFLSDDIHVTIIIIRLIKSRWHFMDRWKNNFRKKKLILMKPILIISIY